MLRNPQEIIEKVVESYKKIEDSAPMVIESRDEIDYSVCWAILELQNQLNLLEETKIPQDMVNLTPQSQGVRYAYLREKYYALKRAAEYLDSSLRADRTLPGGLLHSDEPKLHALTTDAHEELSELLQKLSLENM